MIISLKSRYISKHAECRHFGESVYNMKFFKFLCDCFEAQVITILINEYIQSSDLRL